MKTWKRKHDALKDGVASPVGEEKEEFEKEPEERLFPLDEVELKRHVKVNEEQKKELSLAELSCILNVPEARTRESSPGELSTPEYWREWYASTLAASEAAKRNFSEIPPAEGAVASALRKSEGDSDERDVGGGKKLHQRSHKREKARAKKFAAREAPVDTTVVQANVGVPLTNEELFAEVPKPLSSIPERDKGSVRH
ncbi:hypothetical protein V7S43_016469 [Phytophthora oleae]|uniref:Ribosome biogenesis protein NOP53 n=1 Tax=Phytophthora oleae TaxID=2107226 RepID=A0ABD3EZU2_9STRA